MKKAIPLFLFLVSGLLASAQVKLDYQKPPQEILDLVDVERAPYVIFDEDWDQMVMVYRDAYKSIEDLSKKEMRLGGLRIDPKTNIGSRTTFYNNIRLKGTGKEDVLRNVSGMPESPRLSNFTLSPSEKHMALTHTGKEGTELWILDMETARMKRLTGPIVNANMRDVINWFEDGRSLLLKTLPEDRGKLKDAADVVPNGPTVSVNFGKKAQNRTYQDLLKNKNDEYNFEQLARSAISRVDLEGNTTSWLPAAMYREISFSPDGNLVLVSMVEKPFSYLVPYYRFPTKVSVYKKNGELLKTVADIPLVEDLPKGFMAVREGKREFSWRADKPATLIYAEALDQGDPAVDVEYRDQVYQWKAPFEDDPSPLIKVKNRYSEISWGNDEVAIATDYWFNTRNTKTYIFNPSDQEKDSRVIFDRNYQDAYNDPGDFVMQKNKFGSEVLAIHKGQVYLLGDGFTPEGQFPFVDKLVLESGDTERIYTSPYKEKYEDIRDFDPSAKALIVRVESPTEFPNYYHKKISGEMTRLTSFENPFESLQGIHKEVVNYKRDDGVDLSGTLYLPSDYADKGKLPLILWAYPTEYKDKASAGQNTNNPNRFTYPSYGSMIYWVTQGYAVLDDASFPIIGEGEKEPNDTFRTQLVANAKAAIDALDSKGIIDPDRVAVGGHSYGAFMVANLLSHSDLFAAGIARSGAYNRTLTPFGFQREERSYWEAPEVYYNMSPFMHADKMKTPLLLIHGEADNNSGTYPMQSERYFNALKGLGATVRLVILPKESHGYRSKESILHLLWEQDQWLDRYVKNKNESEPKTR